MKKILVVDDSATSRLLFKVHLPKDEEYEVHEAEDVESAIEKAIEIQPDLVVTDYTMPGRNGVELVELLQEKGLSARYVLLTANTQKSVVDAAGAAGISHVMDKPLTAEKIALVVGALKMIQVSEMELDALKEIANVGMSRAATQLSSLLDDVIEVSFPAVKIAPVAELMQSLELEKGDYVTTVAQSMAGHIEGSVMLMFHDDDSRALINVLISSVPSMAGIDMRDYEHEAMTEIGNIIISAAVAVMADMIGGEIRLSVPALYEETASDIIERHSVDNSGDELYAIIMNSTLTAARRDVQGTLIFMVGADAASDLLNRIRIFLTPHVMV